uniref:Putative secreted protein n=1 Tax=Anopheles darlingi TaxID=43151 RepID=A0A2M4DNM4_ANODA
MSRSHRWPMSCWRTFLTMVAVMMTMMMTANAFPCRARWMVVMVLVSLAKKPPRTVKRAPRSDTTKIFLSKTTTNRSEWNQVNPQPTLS